jgi:hypothetical protein
MIVVGVLISGVFFGSRLLSRKTPSMSDKNRHIINSFNHANDTVKAMFSREQIDAKLKRLAESPAPSKLAYGAECYEIAYRDHKVYEYYCPVCGEKTIYKKELGPDQSYIIGSLEDQLFACRNEIQKVKGIHIGLDETEFCAHCKPNTKEPKLYLLVNIAGQTDTVRISRFSALDIRLIQEFLDDKLVHQDDQNSESPLKDNIERIKDLLGLK